MWKLRSFSNKSSCCCSDNPAFSLVHEQPFLKTFEHVTVFLHLHVHVFLYLLGGKGKTPEASHKEEEAPQKGESKKSEKRKSEGKLAKSTEKKKKKKR